MIVVALLLAGSAPGLPFTFKSPNIDIKLVFQAMANVPSFLADMVENHIKVMAPGAVDAKTKELIAIATATVNGCDYCVCAHSAIGRSMGLSEEEIAEALALAALMSAAPACVHPATRAIK